MFKTQTNVEHSCNPSTQELEARGPEVQGHSQLCSEFITRLSYLRARLKENKANRKASKQTKGKTKPSCCRIEYIQNGLQKSKEVIVIQMLSLGEWSEESRWSSLGGSSLPSFEHSKHGECWQRKPIANGTCLDRARPTCLLAWLLACSVISEIRVHLASVSC